MNDELITESKERDMVLRRMFFCVVVLTATSATFAATYEGIDIEYWAGEEFGSNKATIVVDFGLENYAFEYRWDDSATGWDALNAFDTVATQDKLNVSSTDYGPPAGIIIEDLSYLSAEKYDYGQVFAGWGYYNSDDGDNWAVSGDSCFYRDLNNSDWDCWVWSEFSFEPFGPIREPGQPAPEPCTILLLGLGGLMLRKHRV